MYPWKTFKCRSKEMQMKCQLPDGYPGKLCLLQKLSIQLVGMWGVNAVPWKARCRLAKALSCLTASGTDLTEPMGDPGIKSFSIDCSWTPAPRLSLPTSLTYTESSYAYGFSPEPWEVTAKAG